MPRFYEKGMDGSNKRAMKMQLARIVAQSLSGRRDEFNADDIRFNDGETSCLVVFRTYAGPVMFEVKVKESQ